MDILLPTWLFLLIIFCALALSIIATIIALKSKRISKLAMAIMILIAWSFPILGAVVVIMISRLREKTDMLA
jgi:formate/nitrite transporter FocA (FNT family)